jgi:hypothetical protein
METAGVQDPPSCLRNGPRIRSGGSHIVNEIHDSNTTTFHGGHDSWLSLIHSGCHKLRIPSWTCTADIGLLECVEDARGETEMVHA